MTELIHSHRYDHAPITEAVIQLRVSNQVSTQQQEKVVKKLKKLYPHSNAMQEFSVNVDTTGGAVAINQSPQGFRMTNDDQTDVVLIQPNGITTARVPPYLGWEVLRDRAQDIWKEWKSPTRSQPINRIGVRYVNRIDVPITDSPNINIEDYLNVFPNNPCLKGGVLIGQIVQITQPTTIPHWIYTITSTITPPPSPKHFSLLLDVDVFRTDEIPLRDDSLWEIIEHARGIKNDIFERCITDKTRELIS